MLEEPKISCSPGTQDVTVTVIVEAGTVEVVVLNDVVDVLVVKVVKSVDVGVGVHDVDIFEAFQTLEYPPSR